MNVKTSLFERVGGFAKVRLIVSEFYDRLFDSDQLRPYFEDIDVPRLIDHQTKFVSALMGGPAAFTNDHLSRAHGRLGITSEEYDEMAELFRETLEDFDVPEADVDRLHAHLLSLREHVMGGAHAGDAPSAPQATSDQPASPKGPSSSTAEVS